MRQSGTPTKYPGVFKLPNKRYRIRGKIIDPRTGKTKEVDRVIDGGSAQEAARQRAELLGEARWSGSQRGERVKVRDYAGPWMKSKALKLDPATAERYTEALEMHILPALGEFFYDALAQRDVQEWVDDAFTRGRTLASGERKPYGRQTVHGWFRVLRTMTRDAMGELGLERDPTLRISFPEAVEAEEANALSAEELARFLDEMRERYPQHFALTAVLAFTGLRFCHASALQWEDWNERSGVLRVVRKQVRGHVGPVTRRKRVPRKVPVEPDLAEVLRWHRRRMLAEQAPGLAEGWMFPSSAGTLRTPSSVFKAWQGCMKAAGIDRRFTVHGMRYTFTDAIRPFADPVVRRALTGHVTEAMQDHYSHVGLDEMREAVARVHRLVNVGTSVDGGAESGDQGGDQGRK